MNIPNVPHTQLGVLDEGDVKKINLHPDWMRFFTQLINELQSNASNEGIVMPSQTATNVSLLTNKPNGALVYNANTHKALVNINGTFKEIITT